MARESLAYLNALAQATIVLSTDDIKKLGGYGNAGKALECGTGQESRGES